MRLTSRKQVLDCEERFKDMYSRNLIRGFEVKDEPLLSETEEMKEEIQSMDDEDDDTFLNFNDGDDDLTSDLSATADAERKTRSKGKAKSKPKKAKQDKKTKTKRPIKDDETELTEAAVSGEKKKDMPLASKLSSLPYVCKVEDDDGGKKYFCSECNTPLLTLHSIKFHIRTKHTDIKEKCPICDEQLKTIAKKKSHLRSHNLREVGKGNQRQLRELQKSYCEPCKKEYKSKQALRVHMSNHHTLKKCPDCQSLLPAYKMSLHRNDVHGTPIPTCGICGYRNAIEYRVLMHQRQVHLREKTVSCNICNMTFFNERFLKRHLIKHKPDKIHECSYCHKKFPRLNTLRMHEKIHKGEKNKVCSLCGERFVQKASLNYHMGKHHPDAC
ncbi:uncharacterized protein isoform X2 [Choristoneura fumiferana]|uniref:uncharacterized protein isoform X2 n=1 Tax=Choristoneura fumiferana TaxID=7141 RepID=UPI003D157CAC